MTVADPFTMYVCAQCGFTADGNRHIGAFFCRYCETGDYVKTVKLPFTSKLMSQELAATGISTRLRLTDME